jgi:hypothetical protein
MRKNVLLLSVLIMLIHACGPGKPTTSEEAAQETATVLSEQERGFLDKLSSLCGKSFRGKETYMAPGRESWADKDFVMHVVLCEEDRVHIPFHLDDDTSRTWLFLAEDGRLRFRHDHRHPDGTPEESTLYGGYSDGRGTSFAQYFPADAYTVDLLVDTLGRQWNIVLDEDMTNFSYQLQYHGEIVFQADFDLTNPITP